MNTALEQRTAKYGPTSVVPTGFAFYAYDEAGHLLGEYDSTGIPLYDMVWLGDQPLAAIKQTRTGSGTTLNVATRVDYIYADHLNTPRVIVRSTDHVPYWRWDNSAEPFGAVAPNNNPNALGAYTFNLRLPGQIFDSETGMFYNMHRDYVAQCGRYTQSDPIGLAGGVNTYSYVNGSPLMYMDPYGLWAWGDPLSQGLVDYSAGFGDALSFGLTNWTRNQMDINGAVNKCSGYYTAGEWSGVAFGIAIGGAVGLEAAGTKGAGKEFSHWIPNRMGGPRSPWNGNYVSTAEHALSDPYR